MTIAVLAATLTLPALLNDALAGGRNEVRGPQSASPVRELIVRHAAAHSVPPALADAVVRIESGYRPQARNGPNLGLGQISHATARGLGYRGSAGGLLNAETNLAYSMRYLGEAYRLAGGDICGTVMRYQNGHGARRMTGANLAYCAKVRRLMAIAR